MDGLLLVDIQNDFLPGGALAVAEGDKVVPVANRLMESFELVVATQDWHPANHGSFASQHPNGRVGEQVELNGRPQILWPDHCVQGSPGADFGTTLLCSKIHQVVFKGTDPKVDSYSGFFDNGRISATALTAYLKRKEVTRLFVLGLATDFCVKFTVMDALDLGFETHLVLDGCRGVELSLGDVERAVSEMACAGANVTHAEAVVGRKYK